MHALDARSRESSAASRAPIAVVAMSLKLRTLLIAIGIALVCAAPASAQQPDALVPQSVMIGLKTPPPRGFDITPRQALAKVTSLDKVRRAIAGHPRAKLYINLPLYGHYRGTYAVTYIDGAQGEVLADVYVNGRTGDIFEAWTGPQAGTFLARGLKPSVGRALNRPYIWLSLAALFLLPFIDPRRPFRLLHLDLLVLLSFGASEYFFNKGDVNVSIPAVYPPLVYLLVRMLFAGFRPRPKPERLVPYFKESWLWIGLGALLAFRIGLNVMHSGVIDVGYASAVGADRIMHGQPLYVFNDIHGDTYGPINYLSYIPFVQIFPWDRTWTAVIPAHAAAITWDLLTVAGLVLLGRRMRVGPAFAFAFAAYPFSVLALQTNTNDGLIAALLVWALVAITTPLARGLLIGLAAGAKFAPLALAPLFATGLGDMRKRWAWPPFAIALAVVMVGPIVPLLPDGGWREFYDTTIGFQLGRTSPFSLYGLYGNLGWLQDIVKVGAAGLAVAVAFVPRKRSLRQVAALSAAVLIGLQLCATYWFYLYLEWIAPAMLIAMLAAYRVPEPAEQLPPEVEPDLHAISGNGRAQILVQPSLQG
jgi:glycosyl transferase family 87